MMNDKSDFINEVEKLMKMQKVFIVSEDINTINLFEDKLSINYHVQSESDPYFALEKIKLFCPDFIVLDIELIQLLNVAA